MLRYHALLPQPLDLHVHIIIARVHMYEEYHLVQGLVVVLLWWLQVPSFERWHALFLTLLHRQGAIVCIIMYVSACNQDYRQHLYAGGVFTATLEYIVTFETSKGQWYGRHWM